MNSRKQKKMPQPIDVSRSCPVYVARDLEGVRRPSQRSHAYRSNTDACRPPGAKPKTKAPSYEPGESLREKPRARRPKHPHIQGARRFQLLRDDGFGRRRVALSSSDDMRRPRERSSTKRRSPIQHPPAAGHLLLEDPRSRGGIDSSADVFGDRLSRTRHGEGEVAGGGGLATEALKNVVGPPAGKH